MRAHAGNLEKKGAYHSRFRVCAISLSPSKGTPLLVNNKIILFIICICKHYDIRFCSIGYLPVLIVIRKMYDMYNNELIGLLTFLPISSK